MSPVSWWALPGQDCIAAWRCPQRAATWANLTHCAWLIWYSIAHTRALEQSPPQPFKGYRKWVLQCCDQSNVIGKCRIQSADATNQVTSSTLHMIWILTHFTGLRWFSYRFGCQRFHPLDLSNTTTCVFFFHSRLQWSSLAWSFKKQTKKKHSTNLVSIFSPMFRACLISLEFLKTSDNFLFRGINAVDHKQCLITWRDVKS